MFESQNIIAIDGPSGVGKSTISKKVAALLGLTYLDTGAMYRAVALYLKRNGVDAENETELAHFLAGLDLQLLPSKDADGEVEVLLGGEDVSAAIRTQEISMAASAVSRHKLVREKLTQMQQEIGQKGKVIAEGRDVGTVVFPHARHKFYLDADPAERAQRRVLQLHEKGMAADKEEILAQTLKRDKNDSERDIAPLTKSADATLIDTTRLTIDEVIQEILKKVQS